ncbi:MAG: ankyrin repeat domain-containing protein [Coxiellaceae bacterium]|nr:ankyrin repeat domain-containing protein [Coxiellaceae bacterium]
MPCKFESRDAYVIAVKLSGPLLLAVKADDLSAVRELVAKGARVDYPVEDGGFRKTMLTVAVENKQPRMMRLLVAEYGCNPNDKDNFVMGESPLSSLVRYAVAFKLAGNEAEYQCCKDGILMLIDHGANVNLKDKTLDVTALVLAKDSPDAELYEVMLQGVEKRERNVAMIDPLIESVVGEWFYSIFPPVEPKLVATDADADAASALKGSKR